MRGRHSSFEGDPKDGGTRVAGRAGEVRSRRDAKRRARAQLNNGLPYPPSPLTRALRLFVPSVLVAIAVAVAVAITPLSESHPTALVPSSSLIRSSTYLPTYLPTYLLPTYLPTPAVYLLPLISPPVPYRVPISHLRVPANRESERRKSGAGLSCRRVFGA